MDHNEINGENDDKDNCYNCCSGDSQERGTAVEWLGGNCALGKDSFGFFACGEEGGGLGRGKTISALFCTGTGCN